jgi:hypothetical protein
MRTFSVFTHFANISFTARVIPESKIKKYTFYSKRIEGLKEIGEVHQVRSALEQVGRNWEKK